MTPLLRVHFDRELTGLHEAVLALASMARAAVASGLKAFIDNDVDLAGEVIAGDQAINGLRYQIERRCYAMLATEQPVAGDMRAIVSALSIADELERIADHGKKIARICQRIHGELRPIPLNDVARMGELVLAILDHALQILAALDAAGARTLASEDDQIDALYKQTFNITLSYMLENVRAINAGAYILQVAHELERIADRATNVAERLIFNVTGELLDLND